MIEPREDNVIGEDFQGWPICKMTLREILLSLGLKKNPETGNLEISDSNPNLDLYPRTLEDDGMGYGVNEKYITEASVVESKEENFINIFIDEERHEENMERNN